MGRNAAVGLLHLGVLSTEDAFGNLLAGPTFVNAHQLWQAGRMALVAIQEVLESAGQQLALVWS